MEQLLQQWGLEAIAPVGQNYDPQLHQLLEEGLNQAKESRYVTPVTARRQAALPSQGESHLRVLVMLERLLTIVL